MSTNNLTSQRLPISEMRKNVCSTIAVKFMDTLVKKGYTIDDYTNWFISSVFERILAGPKAYRVYEAHDPSSKWYVSAKRIIKEGTLHHMYLKDNDLQYGIIRDKWCKEKLSIGKTKEETVYAIAELICSNNYFLNAVKHMQIKRRG